MSSKFTRALIVLGAVLVLGGVDYSIYGKERVIREGETIYLELAPVDPRSLMQGDYMALRFRLADRIQTWRQVESRARRRTAPLRVDDGGVATLGVDDGAVTTPNAEGGGLDPSGEGGGLEPPDPGDPGSPVIAFRIRGGRVWLGTNAYFFEEGTGERYESARYGEFRLDPSNGEAVLVGLRDAELDPL